MKYRRIFLILWVSCIVLSGKTVTAQNQTEAITQTLKGIVFDATTGTPLSFVSVGLVDHPQIGAMTDSLGQFILRKVPVGRASVRAFLTGYSPYIVREVLVISSKEIVLEIPLKENDQVLSEVVVHAFSNDDLPINTMALSGARMLSVEQASRYAGGLDDPARFVSAFAGVASSVSSNGISIHGNAPHLLQWRLEDVEIPNPNHFADITTLGGGVLSSLSNKVLGNSDFLTSAFPAEYGNAISGVFDMKFRNGNSEKFEHTLQAGILGLEAASEGPLSKKNRSSYLVNYRYSTTGLMSKFMSADLGGVFDYQDLNFKLNFPTRRAGTFSIWGTALVDIYKNDFEDDPSKWEYFYDRQQAKDKQYMAAGGLSHRYYFNENTVWKTVLSSTYSKFAADIQVFDNQLKSSPYGDLYNRNTNLIASTSVQKKFGSRFTNKTGITVQKMYFDMDLRRAPYENEPLKTMSEGHGDTELLMGYTSSSLALSNRFTLNFGLNSQYLTLNDKWTLEPRLAWKWQETARRSWALAYGLHSRMERMDVYFVRTPETGGKQVNKDLDFTKTHHLMVTYNYKLAPDMNLRIEPYVQFLFDVPVIADSSYCVLNRDEFYVEDALVNEGKGRNIGVDVTFEKYLSDGYYYMASASFFDSRYKGGDGVWYNTKFNRNFIVNALAGKEWLTGRNKNKIWSVNIRGVLQGGDRYSPVDTEASLADPDKIVQYNERKAYSKQFKPVFMFHYTVSYRINLNQKSHEFAIKMLNGTGSREFYGHSYNYKTNQVETNKESMSLGNISYKFEF